MMTSGTGEFYSSTFSAFKTIVGKEGIMTLYKGWGANILRSLAGGLVLASADIIKDAYISVKMSL